MKRGWWNIILFNMIEVDRNAYAMFNFFHECKFSPPHYLRSARTLVGKFLFENSAQICGVLDEICTFGIQTGMYGICICYRSKLFLGCSMFKLVYFFPNQFNLSPPKLDFFSN